MTQRRPPVPSQDADLFDDEEEEAPSRATISMISAYGAFRAILIGLTIWTFFEGFALATGALSPVDAGADRSAERILGGLMIVLGGVYGMIAWQRERYRLLLWVPFATQLAIVVPLIFEFPDRDSMLLLLISAMFLALMCYVWWRSREMAEAIEEEWEEDEGYDEEEEEVEEELMPRSSSPRAPSTRIGAQPTSGGTRKTSKFRRRDV